MSQKFYLVNSYGMSGKIGELIYLFEVDSEEDVYAGFEYIHDKLPSLDANNHKICNVIELSKDGIAREFEESKKWKFFKPIEDESDFIINKFINTHIDDSIGLYVKKTKIDTYILYDADIPIYKINKALIEKSISAVHLINIDDKIGQNQLEKVNHEIMIDMLKHDISFSVFPLSSNDSDIDLAVYKLIFEKNNHDMMFIFHQATIDFIMNASRQIYEMIKGTNHKSYFYYVDKNAILYKISIGRTLNIERVK